MGLVRANSIRWRDRAGHPAPAAAPVWVVLPLAAGITLFVTAIGHAAGLRGYGGAILVVAVADLTATLAGPTTAAAIGAIGAAFGLAFVVEDNGTFPVTLAAAGFLAAAALSATTVALLSRALGLVAKPPRKKEDQ